MSTLFTFRTEEPSRAFASFIGIHRGSCSAAGDTVEPCWAVTIRQFQSKWSTRLTRETAKASRGVLPVLWWVVSTSGARELHRKVGTKRTKVTLGLWVLLVINCPVRAVKPSDARCAHRLPLVDTVRSRFTGCWGHRPYWAVEPGWADTADSNIRTAAAGTVVRLVGDGVDNVTCGTVTWCWCAYTTRAVVPWMK